jgi:hypothetical protein
LQRATSFSVLSPRRTPGTGDAPRLPAEAADLMTRWCSAYIKIMVMDAAIRNQHRFLGKRTPVLTGGRYDESTNRQT